MTAASYKHLCLDANDLTRMAAFWGAVLGLEAEDRGDEVLLRGDTPQHSVWIERVPEPVTVKQRVHLDVHAGSAEDVLGLGATPLDRESFRWQVLRDPEGGELCVFERADPPAYRLYELVVDAAEPERIAQWWADLLGGVVTHEDGDAWWSVEQVPGLPFEAIVFQAVPEPKTVKNRVHWDVDADDVALLTAAGASLVRARDDEISWTVLADPEGNEFCAFERATAS
jgi:catechol 2,3-dioxygenase-like lactoylglutathione lyase family enzyme